MPVRPALAVATIVLALLVAAAPTAALPPEHCVVEATSREADGLLRLTEPRCYPTFRAMLTSIGVHPRTTSESPALLAQEAVLLATIGIHFEHTNQGGASLTVTGIDCAGGYTNLTLLWRNRISSTVNGCPRIRHFEGLNKTGNAEDTTGSGGNLGPLDNRADSIQYLT